jgi:hypothetical protein
MNKIENILLRLKQTLPINGDGVEADLTYKILSDAMKREGVTTFEVLQELEDCLNVHVAYNTNLFMRVGSPKNAHTAIPLAEAAHIAEAYYHLLQAQLFARQKELNWNDSKGNEPEEITTEDTK